MNHAPAARATRRALLMGAALAGLASRLGAQTRSAPLEFGLLPNLSPRVLLSHYQPVREHLESRLGTAVQLSTAPNWPAFYQRTAARDYDLIVTAANMARVAQLDHGYAPLVSYAPRIRGLLVTGKARPITEVAQLRGGKLGLSNPLSLVTLRGMQWLGEQGLRRDQDFQSVATPSDDSIGNLLLRGDCVAALVSGGEFRAIPDALREQLQVMTTFAEVPSFIVAAGPRYAPAQLPAMREAWLALPQAQPRGEAFFASTGFNGIVEATPALMASLDIYAAETRRLFAGGG